MDQPRSPSPHQAEFLRLWTEGGWKNRSRVARELGISHSTVSRYLDLKIEPTLPVLRLFAEKSGQTLRLPGEPDIKTRLGDSPRFLADWETEAIRALRRIRPDVRNKLLVVLSELMDQVETAQTSTADQQSRPNSDLATLANLIEADAVRSVRAVRRPAAPKSGPTAKARRE